MKGGQRVTPNRPRSSVQTASEPFLVLPENRFAYTAVSEWKPRGAGKLWPLLYLYGPSGIGKSHLARHALRLALRQAPDLKTHEISAMQFAGELAAVRFQTGLPEFRGQFADLDLLLVEDLQGLASSAAAQEALVVVLDELLSQGCRVLVTGRHSPGTFNHVSRRLLSRLRGGIAAELKAVAVESRRALIQQFAETRQIPLNKSVVELLAARLAISPRELAGAVDRLESAASAKRRAIDDAFTAQYLAGEVESPALTLSRIGRAVAKEFGVSATELRARGRVQALVLPRQCAMLLARELTGKSLARIGEFFGGRDHSTVLYACQKLHNLVPHDAAVRQQLAQIRQALNAG